MALRAVSRADLKAACERLHALAGGGGLGAIACDVSELAAEIAARAAGTSPRVPSNESAGKKSRSWPQSRGVASGAVADTIANKEGAGLIAEALLKPAGDHHGEKE